MKCIIIEDQPPAQRILKKYIADYGSLELVGAFPDALKALDFLQDNEVDLIFLDLHLPKLSGIDFLKTVKQRPEVILTTAFSDFALESYDFDVKDYLLKPFSFSRFVKAVQKIPREDSDSPSLVDEAPNDQVVFIKSGYDYVKVNVDDILFITSDGDYTELVTRSKKHLSSESLKYWNDYFSEMGFIQTHKSYIVQVNKIRKIATKSIDIGYEKDIPIGRAYKEEFSKRVLK